MPDDVAALEEAKTAEEPFGVVFKAAEPRSLAMTRDKTLPLEVAQVMLSILLVAGSAFALAGRSGGKALVTQALVANAIFGAIDYALTKQTRTLLMGELSRAGAELAVTRPETKEHFAAYLSALKWSPIFSFVFIGLAMLAIQSRRARLFFETARESEQRRAPDDEDEL